MTVIGLDHPIRGRFGWRLDMTDSNSFKVTGPEIAAELYTTTAGTTIGTGIFERDTGNNVSISNLAATSPRYDLPVVQMLSIASSISLISDVQLLGTQSANRSIE